MRVKIGDVVINLDNVETMELVRNSADAVFEKDLPRLKLEIQFVSGELRIFNAWTRDTKAAEQKLKRVFNTFLKQTGGK